MLQQIEQIATTQQNQLEMSSGGQQPQSVDRKQQPQQQQISLRLPSGKRQSGQSQKTNQQMVAAAKAQTVKTQTVPQQPDSTTPEDKLETAKKLISAGISIPVQ